MKWIREAQDGRLALKSWCAEIEASAEAQIDELRRHPVLAEHVALMPDCHFGKGMPIGGVIAVKDAVIPSAVGVDIGCGMVAVETNLTADVFTELRIRRELQNKLKERIPVGEGVSHKEKQNWDGFEHYLDLNGTVKDFPSKLDRKNLGSLGGGNHFIELQKSDAGFIWLMIHSGSRNLGQRIEKHYWELANKLNSKMNVTLPNKFLTFLPMETQEGNDYYRDMNFALEYAMENRRRMMSVFKKTLTEFAANVEFIREINIHHNYAAKESHFGQDYYIHRKGATSARIGEIGIIPGSMGTPSFIVSGLGNPESFMSCSHGAGRTMSRTAANDQLTVEQCDKALTGIVYERWSYSRSRDKDDHKRYDLSEAPQAYKPIDQVISAELDLVEPIVRLNPLAVLKG